MIKRIGLYIALLAALLLVAACGSTEQAVLEVSTDSAVITRTRLNEDHADASTIQAQLAVGTLQLEEGELAIDEALANELLPLWQALQALAQSDTTASAEITAVLNQIQDSMQPEQIIFIDDQNITNETITTLAEEGVIRLGGGRGGAGGGPPAGGGAGGDGGGGRGGGGAGGGALGGGAGGGGAQGAGGNADPDALATRRAERFGEEGGGGDFLATAVTGSVVQLLSVKTGAAVERDNNNRGGNNEAQQIVNGVVATALGISEEELTAQVTDDIGLPDLIAASDIDIDALRSELATALADTPPAQNGNLDGFLNRILGEGQ